MLTEVRRLAVSFIRQVYQYLAAIRHRLAAGNSEVDKNLLDLATVGLNGPNPMRWLDFQGDAFAKKPVEHFHQLIKELLELKHALACGGRFAEGEELIGE